MNNNNMGVSCREMSLKPPLKKSCSSHSVLQTAGRKPEKDTELTQELVLTIVTKVRGSYIIFRWYFRTCCARMKKKIGLFGEKKSDLCLLSIKSNAFNRSNNRDWSLLARLVMVLSVPKFTANLYFR